ncbi:MAG TPA: alpha-amylase family glycosyl hydrolase [Steroidobacteraceae bacterium]|nr:alpha-amylase family glycosyl hydrolase [Steroidobacteraceae bacterium]
MSTAPLRLNRPAAESWWRGAVIYHIYPRSFADSNGDGIGDLPGITARLEYVASLGVDAIWLSPFFTSPMKDFGYDISDYCDVDPIFGTLTDFDRLLARAHELGLRVVIDQVLSHTSDQHPWFRESRVSRDNPRADWYVWADPRADGTPPNNWQSQFGGSAWTWDARRRQYFMHNFLPQQPDLNVHNPAVQEALFQSMRFWFERGVDGFRLDAINHAMHDRQLRDNPPALPGGRPPRRSSDFQQPLHNRSQPEMIPFLERIRVLTEEYGGRFTVAEIGGEGAESDMPAYTQGSQRLHTAYGFNFLYADTLSPALVRRAMDAWPDTAGTGWPSWAFSNHDAPRAVSRWAAPADRGAVARFAMLLLLTLRGNVFLYQGEELGLPQAQIPFEDLRDPEAIANWPLTLGRDGARTPMPWLAAAPQAGFTTGKPWLPLGAGHAELAVQAQQHDAHSTLNLTRHLLAFRRRHAALRAGSLRFLDAPEPLLAFERRMGGVRLLCLFNFGEAAQPAPAELSRSWRVLEQVGGASLKSLPRWSGLVAAPVV